MKCLVTGASGSVGSRIVRRLLEEGHEVRCLIRSTSRLDYLDIERVELCVGDLTDPESLERAVEGVEWIFHSAAPVDDWLPAEVFHAANVDGSRDLVRACRLANLKRFVFLSSVNVYGVNPPPNADETTPYKPCGIPYCDTKIEAEKIFLDAYHRQGIPVTVLRPANVWGPTANAWTIRPVRKLLRNEVFLIAGGRGSFNPIYVDNLAEACLLAAEKPEAAGEVFVITDGIKGMIFRDFFDRLADMLGVPRVTRSIPKWFAYAAAFGFEKFALLTGTRPMVTRFVISMLTKNCYYDTSKIRDVLGYRPRYTFEEGLERTRRWLKEQRFI